MSESKISFTFELVPEDEVITTSRKKKLPEWEPILSWNRPALSDKFWSRMGYGQPTERDFKIIEEAKRESLRKQNEEIDKELELLGVRIENIKAVRNQKEVRIKL